ncbi:MAG: AMP-binding protein [Firmicutes bacterium]|nr:AMP-binding protein [Bacillota bacterium]
MAHFEDLAGFIQRTSARAPAVREILERAGARPEEIRNRTALARLPVTRKTDLIDRQRAAPPFGGFLGVAQEELQRIFMSPGPLYDPHGQGKDYWRWGEALQEAGFRRGDLVLNTFSYHLSPAGFMFDEALRSLGAVVIPAGVGNTELQVRLLADLAITGYVGTPSFLATLLDKAVELGYDPAGWRLQKAFVTAERLPDSLRDRLQGQGIAVFQGYGTADVGCVAYECGVREGLHLSTAVIVEIVDPETGQPALPGEVGEIVVTVLDETYPLLRFGTGDLSLILTEPCRCGRETPRLGGLRGRLGDAVKVKGMFVYLRQIEEVMQRFPQVGRYQVIVSREDHRDHLLLRLEPRRGGGSPAAATGEPAPAEGEGSEEDARLTSGDVSGILATFRDIIRLRPEIEVLPPGSIPEGAKGLEDRRQWNA